MSSRAVVQLNERTLVLTNLDKPFWPEENLAKRDLVSYYVDISPFLLPYLKNRLLVLTRYPDGAYGKAFYQKDKPNPTPEWIRTFPIFHQNANKAADYILADEPAGLAWIGNLGCIELHCWQSRIDTLDYPDYAVIDLDPADGATFADVRSVADLVRQVLDEFGLRGYLKTTGASGLHIFVPTIAELTYPEIQLCVQFLATVIRDAYPQKVTLERVVNKRTGKVYIDYLQNTKGKTMVSVFSPRPKPGATVSFPITWDLLPCVTPKTFGIANALSSLCVYGDNFAGLLTDKQDLKPLFRAAEAMLSPKRAAIMDAVRVTQNETRPL